MKILTVYGYAIRSIRVRFIGTGSMTTSPLYGNVPRKT